MTRYWTGTTTPAVGDTSVTINNNNITTSSVIKPFASTQSNTPVKYSKIVVTSGKAVISFPSALTESPTIKLQVINGT